MSVEAPSSDRVDPDAQHRATRGRDVLRQMIGVRYASVVIALIVICVFLSIQQDAFLTWGNWQNILRSQAVVMVLGIGATIVVLTGGLDLSVGSMTAAAGMIVGLLLQHGASAELACLGGMGAGLAMGLINGLLIGKARISFLVVTVGTLSIYQTVALVLNSGKTISLFTTAGFERIGNVVNGSVGSIPAVFLVAVALYAIAGAALHLTTAGRAVYAAGSNPDAAHLTGINLPRLYVGVYTIAGLFAGIGAIIAVGRLSAASPQTDPNLLLNVLAAVLIGGTAYTGGAGGVLGTLIGTLFLGVIQNGLQLSDVSTFWQGAVSGTVLIVAVGLGVVHQYGWWQRLRRGRAWR
jgi:ribose transport system permease protein